MSVNISTRVSAIYQATSDSVCGYALSILKKPHDAQDVKQRTDITFLFPLYILRLVCNLLAELKGL